MKILRFIAFLALLITLISCKQEHCKTNTQKAAPVRVKLLSVNFTLNKFAYSGNDTINDWYYPYQVVLSFKVTNNSSKDIILMINDSLSNNDNYYQGIIRYNNSPVICEDIIRVEKENSNLFNCYILDLPIFDSIFCREEFAGFIEGFRDHLHNEVNIISKGKKLSDVKNIISIYSDDSFHFHFIHWKENRIKLKKVGYPLNEIPDSITVIKPSPGIEW